VPSHVTRLESFRTSPHAYGRKGDLVLSDETGASLTFAATEDEPGHRPLRGALIDIGTKAQDQSDPLLYWRAGWRDAGGRMHPLIAKSVTATAECANADEGVRIEGIADGVSLVTVVCPEGHGQFHAATSGAASGIRLPEGAAIADEIHPGTATALIDGQGSDWDGEHPTSFVALAEYGLTFLVQGDGLRASRNRPHIAAEVFTSPIAVRYSKAVAMRTLTVAAGDALDALNLVAVGHSAQRQLAVTWQGQAGATLTLQDGSGRPLATGALVMGERTFRLPDGFGALASVRDGAGVAAADAWPISSGETVISAAPASRGTVSLHYTDENGNGLPVHVILRGVGGTPDPTPVATQGSFAAGRSLYLLRGEGTIGLAPGTYQATASHGPAYSLLQTALEVTSRSTAVASGTLRRVVDAKGWISADFHLHAAPSPDAPVPLEARVASLMCEGVDLAVATDHNRITDYRPYIHAAGGDDRLATMAGVEVTTAPPPSWGHFNAFPFAPPDRAPEDSAPPYYDISPVNMLAEVRARGARVIQVNHGRMSPSIGYFDLVHLDPRTGYADPAFSANFDAVEAYNGIYLETPEKVREGALDLVALARRGLHPTATGNSDSHQLLYEEAGYPRTWVHLGESTDTPDHAALLEAMLRGDTSVSSGPFVELEVDGQGIGSHIALDERGSVHAHLRVSAPSWVPVERVELWRNDQVFLSEMAGPATDGVRFETEIDVPIDGDTVLLGWASAEAPLPDVVPYPHAHAIGFTGLIYVDADGDGLVTVPPGALPDAGSDAALDSDSPFNERNTRP
jgi:hypothetical protein